MIDDPAAIVRQMERSAYYPQEVSLPLGRHRSPGRYVEDLWECFSLDAFDLENKTVWQRGGSDCGAFAIYALILGAEKAHFTGDGYREAARADTYARMVLSAHPAANKLTTSDGDPDFTPDIVIAPDILEGKRPASSLGEVIQQAKSYVCLKKEIGAQYLRMSEIDEPIDHWMPTEETLSDSLSETGYQFVVHFEGDAYIRLQVGDDIVLRTDSSEDMAELFGSRVAEMLIEAGYTTVDDVPRDTKALKDIKGIGPARAQKILEVLEEK